MPKITTILFDCDNTLVLSEKWAFAGCAQLANAILKEKGINHVYTGHELMTKFVGMNFKGMMNQLEGIHNFKMSDDEMNEWTGKELGTCIDNLNKNCEECDGATAAVKKLYDEKKYKIAIVSSSAMSRVVASVVKVGQDKYFEGADKDIFSAASSINPPTSKPNPAIYLHACKQLGVEPSECIAVEDSRSGATAAKNAGIHLVGYVGCYVDEEPEKLPEMENLLGKELGAIKLLYHWNDFEKTLDEIQKM